VAFAIVRMLSYSDALICNVILV